MLWIDSWVVGRTYEARDAYLGSGIAELGERSMEEAVLLPEWFDIGVRVGLCGLECHVCIGDLWDWRTDKRC
jgi:hypothetical protein